MNFKKIIILSLLAVMLLGCISSVSAGWFDLSPSTGEISGEILESEIKWDTKHEQTSDFDAGFKVSKDKSYSYMETKDETYVYTNGSLKIKLTNATENQLEYIKNFNDDAIIAMNITVEGTSFEQPIGYYNIRNQMSLDGDVLTINLKNGGSDVLKVTPESGNSTVKSGQIASDKISIKF